MVNLMKKTTKETERYKKYSAKKQLEKVSALHRCSGLGIWLFLVLVVTIDGWMGLDS
jgi:hypothetical protein